MKVAEKINLSDLSLPRLESFKEAVSDFCLKSGSPIHPLNLWAEISTILSGKKQSELWWTLESDKVKSFLVANPYQDMDGKWTYFVAYSWADSLTPFLDHRSQLNGIVEDAFKRGFSRVQFLTRRDEKAFQYFLGESWDAVGTLFERRN